MRSRIYASVMWWDYVQQVAKGAKQAEIAEKAGVNQVTVSRWKKGADSARPENVAAFARAYDRPVLEAFVAAGFLTAEEANVRPGAVHAVSDLDDEALVGEIARRLKLTLYAGGGKTEGFLTTAARSATTIEAHLRAAEDALAGFDRLEVTGASAESKRAELQAEVDELEAQLAASRNATGQYGSVAES